MRKRLREDRGSVAVFLASGILAIVAFIGIAVDVSGQVAASQRAHDIAAQAARAGGQRVNAADIQAGRSARLVVSDAVAAARTYVAGSDATSSTVQARGNRVVVSVTLTYRTKYLSIIGINQLRVTGESDARIAPALEGSEYP